MSEVAAWWVFLCVVSACNVLAWSVSAVALAGQRRASLLGRAQLLLSGGYVFGCAFRSLFPVFDVQRLCVIDSPLSTVLVGRSVATIAELCFVAQWALLLLHVARRMGSRGAERIALALVPMIVVAESCSWQSVLSTVNLGHAIEESLWAASAALVVGALLATRERWEAPLRPLLAACVVGGALYVAYMVSMDVPMYWARFQADLAAGRSGLGFAQGVADAARACAVSERWQDWHTEVVWMSLYFSVAVWLSIALVHLPRRLVPANARD